MANTTNHWKLGLFVVVGVALVAVCLGWLGVRRLEREFIESNYFFDETVDGLDVGSPVKFRGVTIGRVLEIKTAADKRNVHVIAAIYLDALEQLGLPADEFPASPDEGLWVPPELRVQLKSSLLTGVTFIQTDFFDPATHPIPEYPFEIPFETVHSVPSTGKSLELGAEELLMRMPGLLNQAASLMARLEGGIDDLDLANLSKSTTQFLETAEELLARIEELDVVVQASATLSETEAAAAELRAFAAELRADDGPLTRVVERFDALAKVLADDLGEARIAETAAVVREFGSDASGTAQAVTYLSQDLRRELSSLSETLDSMNRLFEMLERDPSSLLYGRDSTSVLD